MGILDIIRRRVVSPALNYLTRTLPRRIPQLLGRKPTQNIQNLRIQPLTKRLGAGGITPGEPLVPVPPEIAPRPPEPLKLPTKRGILTPIPKAIAPKPPTPKNKSFLQGLVGASIFGKPEEQKAFKEGRAKDAPLFSLGTLQNVYKDILFGSVEEQKERKQLAKIIKKKTGKDINLGRGFFATGGDVLLKEDKAKLSKEEINKINRIRGENLTDIGLGLVGGLGKVEKSVLQPLGRQAGAKLANIPGVTKRIPGEIAERILKPAAALEDPFQELTGIFKLGKKKIAEQQKLYTAGRGVKLGKAEKAIEGLTGKERAAARRGAFAGEFEKVPGPEVLVRPEKINAMYNKIEVSPKLLNQFDKLNADTALTKILQGEWPAKSELAALEKVSGPEFIKAARGNIDWLAKVGEGVLQAGNVPRTLMTTGEASYALRQGLPLIRHQKQWWPALIRSWQAWGGDDATRKIEQEMVSKRTFGPLKRFGTAFTEVGGDITKAEEAMASEFAQRIPLVKRFARAHTTFLNKMRFDVGESLINLAERTTKRDVINDPKFMTSLSRHLNNATGRGGMPKSLEQSAVALNAALFSPRLQAARISLLNPLAYVRMDPFVRKEAMKDMFAASAFVLTTLGLAKAGGASINMDPRNADFLKAKVGNTRIDMAAGFQQYARLIAQMSTKTVISSTTGKETRLGEGYKPLTQFDIALRFLEGKETPVFSFISQWMKGKGSFGETFNIPTEIAKRFIPMAYQDIFEAIQEHGVAGAAVTPLPVLGVGLQTYGATELEKLRAEAFGRREEEKASAEEIYSELQTLPREQWGSRLSELRAEGTLTKELYNRVRDLDRESERGELSEEEQDIRSLPIRERASYLLGALGDIPSTEQRAYLLDLKAKGVLTKSVFEEMRGRGYVTP